MALRTDLAEEAHALWERDTGHVTELPGVKARQWIENGLRRHRVEILDEEGSRALGKPRGVFESLWTPGPYAAAEDLEDTLGSLITEMLDLNPEDSVLVVGLGNRAMTPDAVGPLTAEGLLVTRHLRDVLPDLFGAVRPVSALVPGVLGTTGMESLEVVRSVAEAAKPDKIIVVDALAASESDRLCRVIQVTDAGIVPGSGVGNSRLGFSRETLGVPVVAVGAVTVMDASGETGLFVTVRDVDAQVKRLSSIILHGLNRALFPDWRNDEIEEFSSVS